MDGLIGLPSYGSLARVIFSLAFFLIFLTLHALTPCQGLGEGNIVSWVFPRIYIDDK